MQRVRKVMHAHARLSMPQLSGSAAFTLQKDSADGGGADVHSTPFTVLFTATETSRCWAVKQITTKHKST
jgi:hypothetical protein